MLSDRAWVLCWEEGIWGRVAGGGDALKSVPYPHKGQDTLSALSKRKIICFVFNTWDFSPPAHINAHQHLQHPAALSPGSPWVNPAPVPALCLSPHPPCSPQELLRPFPSLPSGSRSLPFLVVFGKCGPRT